MNVTDLPARMQAKITVTEAGCWNWTAAANSRGYGQWGVDGVSRSTHRVAYELLVGRSAPPQRTPGSPQATALRLGRMPP